VIDLPQGADLPAHRLIPGGAIEDLERPLLILDLIGNLIWAGLLCGLGYAIGKPAVNAAKEISKYGLWVTIALVVVIVVFQIRSQRSMLRTTASEAEAVVEAEAKERA